MANRIGLKSISDKLYKTNKEHFVYYGLIAIYLSFLFYLNKKLSLWEDECFSLNTSANPLFKVLKLSYSFEGQPPLYFILLAIWRKINDGVFFARLLSTLFIVISAFVFNKLLKQNFNRYYSKWMVFIFLLNPFTVWAGLEIRLYSLLILLCFLALYTFYKSFYLNQPKNKIWFILICILGVYTQYYFVFFIISLSFLLLFSRGWKSFLNFSLLAMLVALAFIPNLFYIADQWKMHEETQLNYTWYERIPKVLYSPMQFLFSIAELNWSISGRWVALLIVLGSFLIVFYFQYVDYKKNKTCDFIKLYELLIPIITLIIIFNIVFSITDLFYTHRYLTITFPFYCILLSSICILKKKSTTIICILISAVYIVILTHIYHPPFLKGSDVKSVVSYIQKNESDNEPILFRNKTLTLLFNAYYKGENQLTPLKKLTFDSHYYECEVKDTVELGSLIKAKTKKSKCFFIINGHDQDFVSNKKVTNTDLDRFLSKNYQIILDTTIQGRYDFFYLRVRKLAKIQSSNIRNR